MLYGAEMHQKRVLGVTDVFRLAFAHFCDSQIPKLLTCVGINESRATSHVRQLPQYISLRAISVVRGVPGRREVKMLLLRKNALLWNVGSSGY